MEKGAVKINFVLKRFEVTIPSIILYGLGVLILTYKLGFEWGLLLIIIGAIVDILMTAGGG